MKRILLTAVYLVAMAVTAQAQETPPVPLPPTPAFVSAIKDLKKPPKGSTLNKMPKYPDIDPAVMQRVFEIRDRRKYDEAMRNEGRITAEEHENRRKTSWAEELAVWNAAGIKPGSMEYLTLDADLLEAIKRLWNTQFPGWNITSAIREWFGFTFRQPDETRASSDVQPNRSFVKIRVSPPSDEVYGNLKQQLEAGIGMALERTTGYGKDPVNNAEYTLVVPASKTANGLPYGITFTRNSNHINIDIWEQLTIKK